ncbi:hypothetical protein [Bacillus suaedaesalsae]|uniref:TM2 domain-containing protein n=1 Tax=Bacillus suaedaesalsae TaxID=2810349 RepID=A0ABS2DK57_9BACI|nr:hypothetical protein [Bacillus suaedaesalsae]MBM6618848.1 hypothetical protein [Bacillus suaedaesalsae]
MNKSKGLTFILSFVPGLGHFYLGLMNRGLQFMIMFFASTFLADSFFLFGVAIPIIWFFTLFDALQQHRTIKERNEIVDEPLFNWGELQEKKYIIGWVLIGLGGLFLLDQLSPIIDDFIRMSIVRNTVISAIFIYVGYRLITGKPILPTNSKKTLPPVLQEKEEVKE